MVVVRVRAGALCRMTSVVYYLSHSESHTADNGLAAVACKSIGIGWAVVIIGVALVSDSSNEGTDGGGILELG